MQRKARLPIRVGLSADIFMSMAILRLVQPAHHFLVPYSAWPLWKPSFDHFQSVRAILNYRDALWWTAMIFTTLGSEFWPRTFEEVLGFLLSLFSFGVFGYYTAVLASSFVGHDTKADQGTKADIMKSIEELHGMIETLREELHALKESVHEISHDR